jgi:hypothetical protein
VSFCKFLLHRKRATKAVEESTSKKTTKVQRKKATKLPEITENSSLQLNIPR